MNHAETYAREMERLIQITLMLTNKHPLMDLYTHIHTLYPSMDMHTCKWNSVKNIRLLMLPFQLLCIVYIGARLLQI